MSIVDEVHGSGTGPSDLPAFVPAGPPLPAPAGPRAEVAPPETPKDTGKKDKDQAAEPARTGLHPAVPAAGVTAVAGGLAAVAAWGLPGLIVAGAVGVGAVGTVAGARKAWRDRKKTRKAGKGRAAARGGTGGGRSSGAGRRGGGLSLPRLGRARATPTAGRGRTAMGRRSVAGGMPKRPVTGRTGTRATARRPVGTGKLSKMLAGLRTPPARRGRPVGAGGRHSQPRSAALLRRRPHTTTTGIPVRRGSRSAGQAGQPQTRRQARAQARDQVRRTRLGARQARWQQANTRRAARWQARHDRRHAGWARDRARAAAPFRWAGRRTLRGGRWVARTVLWRHGIRPLRIPMRWVYRRGVLRAGRWAWGRLRGGWRWAAGRHIGRLRRLGQVFGWQLVGVVALGIATAAIGGWFGVALDALIVTVRYVMGRRKPEAPRPAEPETRQPERPDLRPVFQEPLVPPAGSGTGDAYDTDRDGDGWRVPPPRLPGRTTRPTRPPVAAPPVAPPRPPTHPKRTPVMHPDIAAFNDAVDAHIARYNVAGDAPFPDQDAYAASLPEMFERLGLGFEALAANIANSPAGDRYSEMLAQIGEDLKTMIADGASDATGAFNQDTEHDRMRHEEPRPNEAAFDVSRAD